MLFVKMGFCLCRALAICLRNAVLQEGRHSGGWELGQGIDPLAGEDRMVRGRWLSSSLSLSGKGTIVSVTTPPPLSAAPHTSSPLR